MATPNPAALVQASAPFSSPAWNVVIFCSIILIAIALFLIFRGIVLWYWKIDRLVDAVEGINMSLGRLVALKTPKTEPVVKEKTT